MGASGKVAMGIVIRLIVLGVGEIRGGLRLAEIGRGGG